MSVESDIQDIIQNVANMQSAVNGLTQQVVNLLGIINNTVTPGETQPDLPATLIAMSGATSGVTGTAVTYTLSTDRPRAGAITVMPTPVAGVTFNPNSITMAAGSSIATFTATATTAGAKNIAVTNNGGLSNPNPITFSVSEAPASAITMTGATTSETNAAVTYTLGTDRARTAAITVTPNPVSGVTFNPTSVNLPVGSGTATFTATATTAGTKSIGVTNSAGLANPNAITLTASAPAVVATKPTVASAPVINGTPQVGVPLNITAGGFSGGSPTPTFTRVIYAGTTQVSSSADYTPTAADVGKKFTVDDIATNSAGVVHNISADSAVCIAASTTAPTGATLRQVATGTHIPNMMAASNTTSFSRTPHILKSAVDSLAIVLPNWYVAGQTETNVGSSSWTASIEYPAGTFKRVTFGGANSVTASDGGNIVSDQIPVSIPKGEKFWVRLFQTAPKVVYFTFYAGDGTAQFTSPATDMTMGGTVTTSASWQAATTTPIAIIGMSADPAVAIYGDSISVGRSDTADAGVPLQGHLGRAFGATYPTGHVGVSGDRMSLFLGSKTKRMSLAQYFTHFALNMGINDITNGATASSVAADTNSIVALFPGPVALCTLSPVSTSSDNWGSTGSQTTHATNAIRATENSRRLAGIAGVKVVYDSNAIVEATNGIWKAPGYTTDGTHPAVKAYKEEAAAIDTLALTGSVSAYPTIVMGPSQITTVSGTQTQGTDFDGVPVLQLPNASSEFAVIPDLPLGVKHDVFINWTVSEVPTNLSPTGLVTFVGELTPWTVGGGTPSGTSRWSGIVPPQAPGIIERSQLPWSVTRATANDLMRIRLGRRADNVGGNVQIRSVEFVPTAAAVEANVTQSGSINPTTASITTAGAVDLHGFSIYTPLRSSPNATYVIEPMTVGGQQQSRIMKLNKANYAVLQDVQIGALNHDSVVGHRDGSVVVTDSGKVICYPEGHHAPWTGKIALTEDLTTLTAMAVPVGLDKHCSYRRFFRNPFDGSTWMGARGNDYVAGVWKFNDSNNTFDRKPSVSNLAGDAGTFLGSYGMELAFGSADVIYATTEFYQGTTSSTLSGYPRQNLSVIKSVDGGATWQTMLGKYIKTPIVQMSVEADIAFPNNNGQHNGVYGRLAVGSDGQPVLVATWQHPSDATRSLWVAKWDNTNKKWIRRRLFRSTTAFDVGNPHLAYHNGKIIVSISTTDDHTPGPSSSGGGGERVPPNNNVLLFVTTDNATSWRRYDLNHLAGGYGGAYIDAESIRLDNKLRMRPVNASAPATSVVWEMAVPA